MKGARIAYTAIVAGAAPLAAAYLLWRSRRQPEYRAHWGERFGWADYDALRTQVVGPLVWIHAVSVGETRAAAPLIDALAARFPSHAFLLTHTTPTGRAAGAEVADRHAGRVLQSYLPYDLPFAVRRFFGALRPVIGIAMETEAWPNLLAQARAAGVPMVLVNARLSERSLRKALRTPNLMREAAANLTLVLAQTEDDAQRLRAIGPARIDVVGNLKFDYSPPAEQIERGRRLRAALGTRPVWLFASTRDGEEGEIINALANGQDDALAVIVPRHPQRFDDVARLLQAHGTVVRRSTFSDLSRLADVVAREQPRFVLGDSMGEMATYYAAADVAFVGGSLLPLGGQNLIEACAVGAPVVVGPHTFNFAQATDDALATGAALRAEDAAAVVTAMRTLAQNASRRTAMREAALRFAAQHRGATARTVERLAPLIEAAASAVPASRAPAA